MDQLPQITPWTWFTSPPRSTFHSFITRRVLNNRPTSSKICFFTL